MLGSIDQMGQPFLFFYVWLNGTRYFSSNYTVLHRSAI